MSSNDRKRYSLLGIEKHSKDLLERILSKAVNNLEKYSDKKEEEDDGREE